MIIPAIFAALQSEGQERAGQIDELGNDLAEIRGQLAHAQVRFAVVERDVSSINATLKEIKSVLEALVAAENVRKGERGVWSAILGSKLAVWLLGIGGTIGAWLWGSSQGGPQ